MRFDTKIAIVVRDDLASWQRLNVTAFLAGGLAHAHPGLVGEAYHDGSGNKYHATFGQPVLIFAADTIGLRRAYDRAMRRGMGVAVYTEELFTTGNDVDNRAAVRAVEADRLRLVGLGMWGPRNAVDKVTKGLILHP